MARRLAWSVMVALVIAGTSQGAAPPAHLKGRLLSLREALSLAVERAGRAKTGDPDPADGEIRRNCAAGQLTHQQRRVLHQTLLNAEVAYWNLAGAYGQLHVRDEGCRMACETLGLTTTRFLLGRAGAADLLRARNQCDLCVKQRQAAFDVVREDERMLRALLGLASGDPPLVPADRPRASATKVDCDCATREALASRPELMQAREEVKASRSTGGIALARAMETLKDQERKTASFLSVQYRRLAAYEEQGQKHHEQRESLTEQLLARQREFLAGNSPAAFLETQSRWAEAASGEWQSLIAYNNSLAGFDFARGFSLQHAHLVGSETPLRSPDKERKRAAAFRRGHDLTAAPQLEE
jgi:hypothetical protein